MIYEDEAEEETMMSSGFSSAAIEKFKTFDTRREIDEYAAHLMSTEYLEQIGHCDVYSLSEEDAEDFVLNCIEVGTYLCNSRLCRREFVAAFFNTAMDYMENIDTAGYCFFSENERAEEALTDKVAKAISEILDQNEEYEKLLDESCRRVCRAVFSKISKVIINGEEYESIEKAQEYVSDQIYKLEDKTTSIDNFKIKLTSNHKRNIVNLLDHIQRGVVFHQDEIKRFMNSLENILNYDDHMYKQSLNDILVPKFKIKLLLTDQKEIHSALLDLSDLDEYDTDFKNYSLLENIMQFVDSYISDIGLENVLEPITGIDINRCEVNLRTHLE